MKRRFLKIILPALAVTYFSSAYAQLNEKPSTEEIKNWYNGEAGMNTEAAYKKMKKKESSEVVVAVIDSGIDIDHEDLQGQIWVNADEIPGNGIDDDNNGYIDDIHGWNFLGNADGTNQNETRLELTRLYAQLNPRFASVTEAEVSAAEMDDYKLYLEVKAEYEATKQRYEAIVARYNTLANEVIPAAMAAAEEALGADYTLEQLQNWEPTTEDGNQHKSIALEVKQGNLSAEMLMGAVESLQGRLHANYNAYYDDRSIIGDNPYDILDVNYGNNDVEGPDALHGTHVGGIIGAVRGNGKGGDGVAENVKLMSLRAVPNGDEHDKDIALAIRYAVDNGAQIINGSFGKNYSPNGKWVYDAIKYAESKGVLFVHAAGNDHKDVDVEPNYPTSYYPFQTEEFSLYLTIGASSRYLATEVVDSITVPSQLAASFSNYGQTRVDVFAPGLEIYNTVQGDTTYLAIQGTSMASPMVAGAAAFLKSYFPELNMLQIKNILLETAKTYENLEVVKPGASMRDLNNIETIAFSKLSVTGGTIDLLAATEAAQKLSKELAKKNKKK
ncbi:Subtilase family protein [Lishizhenia tianjinensis]|uniref:Subtilase family protein n=1 Tax=Lishizhenia tianjinensis TaxID=477690 RepID=A0A1I6YEJ7_9FLAO|nr:S8 family peptidase [Lishizhenia tianjinensis]SFT48949.1 Subtilase family protein [Lishizhenia tianjinensis]